MRSIDFHALNRRDFLRGSALLAAGGWAAGRANAAEAPGPLRVVFATDIHLLLDDALGSARGLAQCLQAIDALRPAPEFILCGGDLTQELPALGLDAAGKHLDHFLSLWKAHTSLPTRWMLGNHDIAGTKVAGAPRDDPRFGEGLFRQRLGLTHSYYSFDAGGWHFVVLDDVVFDAEGGYVGNFNPKQIAFLRDDLAANRDKPTVIGCHIPAVSVVPAMASLAKKFVGSFHLPTSIVTQDTKLFLDTIKSSGAQVKLVLSGHLHHLEQTDVDGIRFINSGAVCGNWWKGAEAGCAEGFTVLDLHPDGAFEANYQTYGWQAVSS